MGNAIHSYLKNKKYTFEEDRKSEYTSGYYKQTLIPTSEFNNKNVASLLSSGMYNLRSVIYKNGDFIAYKDGCNVQDCIDVADWLSRNDSKYTAYLRLALIASKWKVDDDIYFGLKYPIKSVDAYHSADIEIALKNVLESNSTLLNMKKMYETGDIAVRGPSPLLSDAYYESQFCPWEHIPKSAVIKCKLSDLTKLQQ